MKEGISLVPQSLVKPQKNDYATTWPVWDNGAIRKWGVVLIKPEAFPCYSVGLMPLVYLPFSLVETLSEAVLLKISC